MSHQAIAACTGSAGGTIVCTDESTIPFDNAVDFSTTGTSSSDGNYAVKVQATSGNGGEAEVENSKDISATLNTLTATNSQFQIFGMKGADSYGIEEWNLENSGSISAFHQGLGVTAGVFLANDAEAWNINNTGTIEVGRGALSSIVSNATSGAITAVDAFSNSGTLGIAAAVYNNEEEIRDHNMVNDGLISATGAYTAGIFTRSNSFELINNGVISGNQAAGVHGTAAAIVTWDGRLLKHLPDGEVSNCNAPNVCTGREAGFGKSFIENNGTIDGNVIITGLNGLQVMGRIGTGGDPITLNGANGAVPNTNTSGGMVDRRDSEIENNHSIIGNLYYGNGAHVLNNTAEGEIEGNIIVDMRRVTNYLDANNYGDTSARQINGNPYSVYVAGRGAAFGEAGEDDDDDDDAGAGAAPEIYHSDAGLTYAAAMANAVGKLVDENPDRHFTFENAGVYTGDLSVLTVNNTYTNAALLAAAVPTVTITPQTVDLKPHITGTGAGSSIDAPSENSGFIEGRLFIGDGTMAGWTVTPTSSTISADGAGGTTKTTVTPIIDSVVRNGEWFLVARQLYGNNLPGIEGDTVLVSWDIAKNSSGSLVVGSTVADASIVAGLSNPGIATINGLMQGGNAATNALGAALQNLTDEEDVRKAGEQLKPETNFATQQAAFTLNMLTGNYIDNRLNGVGATAPSSAAFAPPSALGMSQVASAAPSGRMSLGLGSNDGRMNVGANDGRMDAGIYDEDVDLRQRGYTSSMWGQAFGAGLEQSERSNVDGYQTHIYGGIAGADNWISPNTRLGFAAGYGNTSIDGAGDTLRNTTDIDSYLGVIYGAYKGNGWYLSTRAGYAWHDYSTKRVVELPVKDTAIGSHSGNQYSAAAEVGAPMHSFGATVTPIASLTWSQLDQDAYQEASQNGAGLAIGSQENTSLATGLGAKTLIPIAASTLLEGRAIWYHEFEDTNQQVTAAFGGGPSFLASGPSVGRDTAALGVGLFAYTEAGVSFQLNYDALLRQDFVGHTGAGRVKVEF